jgi:hypothetical protein
MILCLNLTTININWLIQYININLHGVKRYDRLPNNVLFCSRRCRPSAFLQLNSWPHLIMTETSRWSSSYSLGADLIENTASNSPFYGCVRIHCRGNQMSCVVYRPLPRNGRFILAPKCHVAILILPFSPRPFQTSLFYGTTFLYCSSRQPVVIRCTHSFHFWLYFPISWFILGLQVGVECFHIGCGLFLLLQLMALGIAFTPPQFIVSILCPEFSVRCHIVNVGLSTLRNLLSGSMSFLVFRKVFFLYNVLKLFDLLLFSIRN